MSEESLNSKLSEDADDMVNDRLGSKILSEWNDAKTARTMQDKIFVRAHQNDKGVYPPGMVFSGTSKAKVNVTRPRVNHISARLMEVANPIGELPFTIEPTPTPDMPMLKMQLTQEGLPEEDVNKQVEIAANKAADRMAELFADCLVETSWQKELGACVMDACKFGTGIIQGPLAVPLKRDKLKAIRGLGATGDAYRPELKAVSPLRFYPAPGATDIEDCPWVIIYNTIDKTTFRDFKKQPELFDVDTIEEILSNKPDGDWSPEGWESEIIFSNNSQETGPCGRYQLLIRWGFLSGNDLKEAGIEVDDDSLEDQVMAQVWCVGGRVISVRLSELFRDRLPFYVFPYSEVTESIWGCGVSEAIFDSQDAIDACERALFDNLAYSAAGPITEVVVDRLSNAKDIINIGPRAVVRTKSSEVKSEGRAVNFTVIPSHTNEILAAKNHILQLIQEQTGIPNILMGQGGEGVHERTSSGAYLQFNNAITPIKGLILRLENNVIVPMLHKMKEFFDIIPGYMKAEGDFKIHPRGVSGLVAREVATNKFNMILANSAQFPQLAERVDLGQIVEDILRGTGMGHEKLVYTDAEVAARKQAEAEAIAKAEEMKAQGIAQGQSNVEMKQRAETSPVDVLLTTMEGLNDGGPNSPLKLELIRHALIAKGLMTEAIEKAINAEMDYTMTAKSDEVARLGQERIDREMGMPPMEQKNARR